MPDFDLFSNLAIGFATSLSPENIFYCFVGALLGTLIGVLPGVGVVATVSLLLPITFSLDVTSSLIMLAGIYYGACYGGSTTAILINIPGESASAVTAIDGYQMTRQGKAGLALASCAIGSFIAGTFATLLIALFAIPLTHFALQFGPPEYFSLILLGLVLSVVLAHGSVIKAIAMIVSGLLLGVVGADIYTGTLRFTFGLPHLFEGVDLVALAIGFFGIPEILRNLEHRDLARRTTARIEGLMPTRAELREMMPPILRGTVLGSVLGVLPGGGGLLASFASYTFEKRISRNPERFGHGALEAVAAPESANNAGAQTSFIPMLTLGIPSNPILALMIGALMLHGVVPGPNVATDKPDLFWGVITSMWLGNVMLVVLNLPLIGLWVRLLTIPYKYLVPAILTFSTIGVYSLASSGLDVIQLAVFGLAGYILSKLECEPAPLIFGFVLGPLLEEHLRRAMIISFGNPLIFVDPTWRPVSAVLFYAAIVMLALMLLPNFKRKRGEVFHESET